MKRILLTTLLMFALCAMASADGAPDLPDTMLPVVDVTLMKGNKYPVYTGPGEKYERAAIGKASVSTNDWVQIFGQEDAYYMVQYGVSEQKMRIGWICAYDMEDDMNIQPSLEWTWGFARTTRQVSVTDDPFGAQDKMRRLDKGTQVQTLAQFGEWMYIDMQNMRGFVPVDALEEMEIPYERDAHFAGAVEFLTEAGIQASVTGMNEDYIWFDLENGGRCWWYYFKGDEGFNRYAVGNWHFEDETDEDIALFLDAYLAILAEVERGDAPEAYHRFDYQGDTGRRNAETTVSNGLFYLENSGEQWLHVLLHQLAAHDGNDELNSLRARLASRMLGKLDKTPVDSAQGCAWYDALTLAVQDDLPPVEASTYVDDPVLCQVTQALIVYEDERRDGWYSEVDMDRQKARNIVALKVFRVEEEGNNLTLWANVSSCTYALYDGSRISLVGGSWIPSRITMVKNAFGEWELQTLTGAQDGSDYAPSILAFCDNNQNLADSMMRDGYADAEECFVKYLRANGYEIEQEAEQ